MAFDKKLDANQRGAGSLNQLAYFRALANKDLHLANQDIETAVRATTRNLGWKDDSGLTLPVKATVLATLVARCCNANEEAIKVLTPQIGAIQSQIKQSKDRLTESVYRDSQQSIPVKESSRTSGFRKTLRAYENQAAHLLSCRAIVFRDLGDRVGSLTDRFEVQQLGFDPSQILENLPADQTAVIFLQRVSAYLDTRGFIRGMLPWDDDSKGEVSNFVSDFESAINDINVAIFCSSVDLKSFDFSIRNSVEIIENRTSAKKAGTKNLAVMHNHRLLLFERAGLLDRAESEIATIRELGFESGTRSVLGSQAANSLKPKNPATDYSLQELIFLKRRHSNLECRRLPT